LWPEIVTTSLWNICAQSESSVDEPNTQASAEAGGLSTELGTVANIDISTIACVQLGLRSTGECDDIAENVLGQSQCNDTRRQPNIIHDLLDLADSVEDESWKEMVADLLEHACSQSKPPADITVVLSSFNCSILVI
jgi:hypothetical protein